MTKHNSLSEASRNSDDTIISLADATRGFALTVTDTDPESLLRTIAEDDGRRARARVNNATQLGQVVSEEIEDARQGRSAQEAAEDEAYRTLVAERTGMVLMARQVQPTLEEASPEQ